MQRETLGLGVEFTAVDPWTTWVWTTQIHPSTNFFSDSKYYRTTLWVAGWMGVWRKLPHRGPRTRRADSKLYMDFWLQGSRCPNPQIVQGPPALFFFFLCMTKWSLFKQHCQVPSSQIHLAVKIHANILSFHLHNKCLSNPHIWISKRHLSYCLSHRKSLNILSASCLNFQFKTLGCCSRKVSATRSPRADTESPTAQILGSVMPCDPHSVWPPPQNDMHFYFGGTR